MPRRRSRNRRLEQEMASPPPASAPTSSSTAETPPDGGGRIGGCLHCVWKGLKKWAALSVGRRNSSAAPRAAADPATGPAAPKRATANRATGPAAPKKRRTTHHAWIYERRRKEEDDQVTNPYRNRARYQEYATIRETLSDKFEICHVCFFEGASRWPWDGRIRQSEMITHFGSVHRIKGLNCDEPDCKVRFRSGEEKQLHAEFSQEILMRDPSLRQRRFCLGQRE